MDIISVFYTEKIYRKKCTKRGSLFNKIRERLGGFVQSNMMMVKASQAINSSWVDDGADQQSAAEEEHLGAQSSDKEGKSCGQETIKPWRAEDENARAQTAYTRLDIEDAIRRLFNRVERGAIL